MITLHLSNAWRVLCLLLPLSLLGCEQHSAAQDDAALAPLEPELEHLHQRAIAAGQHELVLYSAYGVFDELTAAFNRSFPDVHVVASPLFGPNLLARIDAEAKSGQRQGDLVLSGFMDLALLAEQGQLQVDRPALIDSLSPAYREPGGHYQIPFLSAYGLAYDPKQIDPQQLPQTFEQLLDERWSGQVGIAAFIGSGVSDVAVATLQRQGHLDDRQLRALASQAQYAANQSTLFNYLSQGRVQLGLWLPSHVLYRLQREGSPLAMSYPDQLTLYLGPGVGLLRDAPNADAARLFKAWLFSARAQAFFATQHYRGSMPGAPLAEGLPEGIGQASLGFDQISSALAETRRKTLAIWQR